MVEVLMVIAISFFGTLAVMFVIDTLYSRRKQDNDPPMESRD